MNLIHFPEALRRFVWKARGYRYRRNRGGPVVLLYHRISRETCDPLLLSVTPERFEEQLDYLKSHSPVLGPGEFVERSVRGNLPSNAVLITFDDGYADNLHEAAPILKRQGLEAAVFVATSRIRASRAPWWDYLDACLLRGETLPASLTLETPDGVLTHALDGSPVDCTSWNVTQVPQNGRQRAYLELQYRFLAWKPKEQEEVLLQLEQATGVPAIVEAHRRFMTEAELVQAHREGVLTLGGHTVNHPRVSLLDPRELEAEIGGSRRRLEQILGAAPEFFAFPFGTFRDYNRHSLQAVRAAGYKASFANMPAKANWMTSRWEIPRVLVRNWSLAEFAVELGLESS